MGAVVPLRGREPPDDDLPPLDADAPAMFERGDHVELAEHTLAALGPHPVTFDAADFWRYHPRGVWERLPAAKVRTVAASFAGTPVGFGKDPKPLKISLGSCVGAESIIRDRLESSETRITFADAPAGAAFRNGFVTVEKGQIIVREHSPENRARHFYDFDYKPWRQSDTPLLMDFLEALFSDQSEDECASRIALLQEFSGACLLGFALLFQACLILYGEGANGKSSLLALLRAMFPPEALASVPPQKWSERFGLAGLEGKRANFVSETPSAEILDGGAFKAVVTGDIVTAERKHKDPFEFRPTAGHIFSMNWPITTTDHSAGFWRRPLILPFSRRFDTDPSRRISPEVEVIEKELGGVVAFAIEGAARAQRQGRYTVPDMSRVMLGEWRDGNDQVRLFLASRPANDGPLPAKEFYTQYREWATENGHRNMVTSRVFGLRVMSTGLYTRTETSGPRLYQRKGDPAEAAAQAALRAEEERLRNG